MPLLLDMLFPWTLPKAPTLPPPRRVLRGVVTARREGNDVDIADSGEHVLRMTRREAQFLMMRLAEALIDAD